MMERWHFYGDLIFETMLWENNKILYLNEHVARLNHGFEILKMNATVTNEWLHAMLVNELGTKENARIRLLAKRNANGFYLPDSNEVGFSLEIFELPQKVTEIQKAKVYRENYKPCVPLSNIKSGNALIYVLAAIFAKENQCEDAIILNEYGRVCEATSSNIFMKYQGKYYTPPLSEGCVDGVMRKVWIQELIKQGFSVLEQPVTIELLAIAEEIWLTNVIQGPIKLNKILL
jgi:branched-chain amino acid aminotransferase